MERLYLKPAEGLVIPSPDHGKAPLPTEGGWVLSSSYWSKRLAEQDVADDTKAQLEREAAEEQAAAEAAAGGKGKKKDTAQ